MELKHIKRMKLNERGRDFIIGDLHGCFDLLEFKLNKVNFDDNRDRLFCVGDLIDRGPNSVECAELIYEPWFFSTQGNHERLFFTYQLGIRAQTHDPGDFLYNGGMWALNEDKDQLTTLAKDMMEMMPYVIFVGDRKNGFAVTHARLNSGQTNLDEFVWDRSFLYGIQRRAIDTSINVHERFGERIVLDPYDPTRRLVYVGHNTVNRGNTVLIDNHLMIDTGAYRFVAGEGRTNLDSRLTMVNHAEYLATLQAP
jgi:serine/threonine protein phosphatase 1